MFEIVIHLRVSHNLCNVYVIGDHAYKDLFVQSKNSVLNTGS